jgi:hypothetical protein
VDHMSTMGSAEAGQTGKARACLSNRSRKETPSSKQRNMPCIGVLFLGYPMVSWLSLQVLRVSPRPESQRPLKVCNQRVEVRVCNLHIARPRLCFIDLST